MSPLYPLLILVLALVAQRHFVARRRERAVALRLPRGADGIIRGAEPYELLGSSGAAVLLLHGFGDTPQTLRYIAAALHERGFTVRVPLLPGHGRTLEAFSNSTADEWLAHALAEHDALAANHESVAVAGLSMGGALAAIIASIRDVRALALIAPLLKMPRGMSFVARSARVWQVVMKYLANRGGERSILDAAERTRSLAYGVASGGALHQLTRIVDRAWAILPALQPPTLVIQSRHDNRITVAACTAAYARIGAPEKQLILTEVGGHIITVDRGRDEVNRTVAEWLVAHAPPRDAARVRALV